MRSKTGKGAVKAETGKGAKKAKAYNAVPRNEVAGSSDKNARLISEALRPLVDAGLRLPRNGYSIRRGRGRVVVEKLA